MELKKTKKTSRTLELEVIDEDETILNPIVEMVLQHKDVDFASCMTDHPAADRRTFFMRLKSGAKSKPEKILEDAVKKLEKEVKDFSKNIKTK